MFREIVILAVFSASAVLASPLGPNSVPKTILSSTKFFAHSDVPDPPTAENRQCRLVNGQLDQALNLANQEFLRTGPLTLPVDGFEQPVFLSYSGASLFVKFLLKTSGGSLRLSTAERSGNATVCTEGEEQTLNAIFQFGNVELKYSKFHAEYFKSSNLDGSLTYDTKPSINVVVKRSPAGCRLEVVTLDETTDNDYKVSANSWMDWVVAQLVGKSLGSGGDSTPIMEHVLDGLRGFVEDHFLKQYCPN